MKAEIRADGLHLTGYVNVPGRESRPVITPRGKVIEVVEQRAFQRAIDKSSNIDLLVDHSRKVGSTSEGNLTVCEDEIGLRAEAVIKDEEVIVGAKAGKLKGWSFDMRKVVDEIEERAGQLPLRRVKDFSMSEVSLIMKLNPIYSSTSIELRADEEEEVEIRSKEGEVEVNDLTEKPKPDPISYCEQENRIAQLRVGK